MNNVLIVDKHGDCREYNNEIIAYSRDEVFDLLETCLDYAETTCKQLARNRAKSDNIVLQIDFEITSKLLKNIEAFWELLRNTSEEEFYVIRDDAYMLKNYEKKFDALANKLFDSIMVKGNIRETTHKLELSVESGASVKTVKLPAKPAYLSLLLVESYKRTYDIYDYSEDITNIAEDINEQCRIYKCKDCGKITYVRKSDDAWKIAHGLKPVQRCDECICKRKAEKYNN